MALWSTLWSRSDSSDRFIVREGDVYRLDLVGDLGKLRLDLNERIVLNYLVLLCVTYLGVPSM